MKRKKLKKQMRKAGTALAVAAAGIMVDTIGTIAGRLIHKRLGRGKKSKRHDF
jgi:hypothetical protein